MKYLSQYLKEKDSALEFVWLGVFEMMEPIGP